MSRTASTESQLCSSSASQLSKRSFPVFSLYSLNAASRIDLDCEDDTGVWEGKDMALMMRDLLVRIETEGSVKESRVSANEARSSRLRLVFLAWENLAPPGLPRV